MQDEFKEKLYFEMYKDMPIHPIFIFRKMFIEKHGEYKYFSKLTTDIIAYQVEKYGMSLTMDLQKKIRWDFINEQKANDKKEVQQKYGNKKQRT